MVFLHPFAVCKSFSPPPFGSPCLGFFRQNLAAHRVQERRHASVHGRGVPLAAVYWHRNGRGAGHSCKEGSPDPSRARAVGWGLGGGGVGGAAAAAVGGTAAWTAAGGPSR